MTITIGKGSSMFGLTYENLQLPPIQSYLSSKGMRVSFPQNDIALIESDNGCSFNRAFQDKIDELERRYYATQMEPSWFVFNEFVFALGSSAVAMLLVTLCGASAMSIAVTGVGVSATAYMMYGLFRVCRQNDEVSNQSRPTFASSF